MYKKPQAYKAYGSGMETAKKAAEFSKMMGEKPQTYRYNAQKEKLPKEQRALFEAERARNEAERARYEAERAQNAERRIPGAGNNLDLPKPEKRKPKKPVILPVSRRGTNRTF